MTPFSNDSCALQAEDAWRVLATQHDLNGERASIDDLNLELSLIRKLLVAVRKKRNSCLGACNILPEILSEIILFARSDGWQPSRAGARTGLKPPAPAYEAGWMAIVHVCSSWRNAALLLPGLWQDVDILNIHPHYAFDILARSENLPLHVTFADSWNFDFDDAHVALAISTWLNPLVIKKRLGTLKIEAQGLQTSLVQALACEAPRLQVLDIQNYNEYEGPFPSIVLDSGLRKLSLHGFSLPSDTLLLAPTLTHLSLNMRCVPAQDQPLSLTLLFHAISAMHDLEVLKLEEVFRPPSVDELGEMGFPDVSFHAAFEQLIVHERGYHAPLVQLFGHLSWPQTASVDVAINEDISDHWEPPASGLTQTCLSLLEATLVRHVPIGVTLQLEIIALHGSLDLQIHACSRKHATTGSYRRIHLAVNETTTYALLRALQLTGIISIVLRDSAHTESMQFSSSVWMESFLSAENVQCITIPFFRSAGLLSALCEPGSRLFPRLDTIIFVDLLEGESDATDRARRIAEDLLGVPPLVLLLTEAIKLRRDSGTPIQKVKVTKHMGGWNVWSTVEKMVKARIMMK